MAADTGEDRIPDGIARRLASLSPAKRALLEREMRRRAAAEPAKAIAARRPDPASAPLSFAQQRLWFLDRLEPGSVAYNEPKAFRIRGLLDTAVLQQALDEIVVRHEILRTTIADVGEPVQRIHPPRPVDVAVVDLRTTDPADRDAAADRILRDAIRRPFDLGADLMLRTLVIRLEDDEQILLLGTHHIASDGWSMGILTRELGILYSDFGAGRPVSLPVPPVQYGDYAWRQRQPGEEQSLTRHLAFWRRQLDGLQPLELPSDRPRAHLRSHRSGTQAIELPAKICADLKRLARREDVTLFMVLLATLQLVLHRYSGQEDVAIGAPIAGRTEKDVEQLIGFFVNTLVLRTDLSGNPTFRQLLERVRATAVGAFEHQSAPFERVVADVRPERVAGRNPFFDVVLAFQNMPSEVLQLPDHEVGAIEFDSGTSKFDLVLTLVEDGDLIRGKLDYCADLFEPSTIRRFAGHFETLLRSAIESPGSPIADLQMLIEAERRQQLVEWNRTATPYPREASVHARFAEQAGGSPEAIALVFGDTRLTYRELDERSNQIAHFLTSEDLPARPLIGVAMERSIDLVVALLGILKAGRAYLPLDPEYPVDRLAYMLRDAQPAAVLTTTHLASRFDAAGVRTIAIDRERERIARQPTLALPSEIGGDDLAYVMYTSGSTGRPKGVEIPHRGIVRLVTDATYVRLSRDETLLHLAPISFDASTFEIWGALLNCGTCAVFSGAVPSPPELGALLKRYRVTTLWLTSSLFNLVVDQQPGALAGLRQLLIGGEALSVPHVQRALASLPGTAIINGYGPTESTTFTCTWRIVSAPPDGGSIPIGRPIQNTEVYVLDSHRHLVPIGVAGELYVGGDGLARGYLNAPDLTAQRFVEVSFGDGSSRRLYRTGDRVRFLPDGTLEFLGRFDDQVKIRGHRIEPGEIEVALARHPDVLENAVFVTESASTDKRLVAYVSTRGPAPAATDFKAFLKTTLPDYMIPSGFVSVPEWPLTPNGKIDRRALRAIEWRPEPSGGEVVPPRPGLEQQLHEIWQRALGLERIGVTDNFFGLGGHSLLAVRVCAEIEAATGKKLPLTALFESPTIAELSRLFDVEQPPPQHWESLLPIRPAGPRPPLFWVHGQASDPLLSQFLDRDQPLYGLIHQAHDGQPARHTTVETIAAHYLREIRTVRPQGPYRLGGFCFGAVVAFEMAQQLRQAGEPIEALVLVAPSPVRVDPRRQGPSDTTAPTSGPAPLTIRRRVIRAVRSRLSRDRWSTRWVRARVQFHSITGTELPLSLRSPYILDVYRRALARYRPSAYPDPITVFSESNADPVSIAAWSTLGADGSEFHRLDDEHDALLEQAAIRTWAVPMARDLDRRHHPDSSRARTLAT